MTLAHVRAGRRLVPILRLHNSKDRNLGFVSTRRSASCTRAHFHPQGFPQSVFAVDRTVFPREHRSNLLEQPSYGLIGDASFPLNPLRGYALPVQSWVRN